MFMLLQDGNGFINRMELRHVMMNLGEKMSEEECDALVDVRPHLSNFKSNFAEENQNTMVGLLDLVKIDQMLQKLKKINIEYLGLPESYVSFSTSSPLRRGYFYSSA